MTLQDAINICKNVYYIELRYNKNLSLDTKGMLSVNPICMCYEFYLV